MLITRRAVGSGGLDPTTTPGRFQVAPRSQSDDDGAAAALPAGEVEAITKWSIRCIDGGRRQLESERRPARVVHKGNWREGRRAIVRSDDKRAAVREARCRPRVLDERRDEAAVGEHDRHLGEGVQVRRESDFSRPVECPAAVAGWRHKHRRGKLAIAVAPPVNATSRTPSPCVFRSSDRRRSSDDRGHVRLASPHGHIATT
jgi:hypothetical protein